MMDIDIQLCQWKMDGNVTNTRNLDDFIHKLFQWQTFDKSIIAKENERRLFALVALLKSCHDKHKYIHSMMMVHLAVCNQNQ